jgi:dTDP-4-amino-4,6-dideoxygalactose transaminase
MEVPLARPFIGREEEDEVVSTLRSGLIGTGEKTAQFEREFAAYVGRKHAIGTNSCTAGLHLSLHALGVGPGDEVITTPMTFVSTVSSIVYTGARPVLADVEPDTLNIDPARIEAAITERTRAIIPVHLYGHPCEMDTILGIAGRKGLHVVTDCAHAIESEYHGRKVGSLGTTSSFSFYALKNLTTGNGGMLVTDDDDLALAIQSQRDHGMAIGAWERYRTGEFQEFPMIQLGFKYIGWDVPASIGIHQLRRVEQRYIRRVEIAARYDAGLERLAEWVQRPKTREQVRHAHHLYVIRLRGVERNRVAAGMQSNGIGVGIHYRLVHLEPYYRETLGHKPGDFPVAEAEGARVLSLPFWPEMKDEEVDHVIETLAGVIEECRGE